MIGVIYYSSMGSDSSGPEAKEAKRNSCRLPLDDHVHTPGNLQLIKICPPSTATYCIHSDDDYQIVLPQFSLRGVHSLPPAHASFSTYRPALR